MTEGKKGESIQDFIFNSEVSKIRLFSTKPMVENRLFKISVPWYHLDCLIRELQARVSMRKFSKARSISTTSDFHYCSQCGHPSSSPKMPSNLPAPMVPTVLKPNSIQPKLEYLPQAIPFPAAQQPIPMASTNPFVRSGKGLGYFYIFYRAAIKIEFRSGWNFESGIHNE